MKDVKPFHMFAVHFIRSFFVIILLVGAGFGSYKLTMYYYGDVEIPVGVNEKEKDKGSINGAQNDKISKNLIYAVDETSGKIKQLVLEIFNTYTYNLDYITIPVDTEVSLSNELYQKFCVINEEIPQIIKLSELNQYFEGSSNYAYGIAVLEDLLQEDISYYTVFDEDYYNKIFTVSDENGTQVFCDDFIEKIGKLRDEEAIKEFIKEQYTDLTSDLTLKNKESYAFDYKEIKKEQIYFHKISGEWSNGIFTVDVVKTNQLIQSIEENKSYTISQEDTAKKEIVSIGLKIHISNGSKISGLAAAYEQKLKELGYTITGIGNYNDNILEHTRIVVKQSGVGQDLLQYFKNAVIETGDLSEGTDIEIILGKEDKIE